MGRRERTLGGRRVVVWVLMAGMASSQTAAR